MSTLTVRGIPLHFHDKGQGLPVLLLHAFPLRAESLWPQLEALSPHFRIIVPDLRGFGESGGEFHGQSPTRMEAFAQDALALLDTLGVQQAVVGGVSMGGYAALSVLRMDPGRVKALILMDTQVGDDDAAGKQKREQAARDIETHGMQTLVDTLLPRLLSPGAPANLRSQVEGWMRSSRPAGAAAAQRGMALRPSSRELLSRFSGPTLVVVGEEDVVTPVAKAQEMAALASASTLVRVPGGGHLASLEVPDVVNAALKSFLRTLV